MKIHHTGLFKIAVAAIFVIAPACGSSDEAADAVEDVADGAEQSADEAEEASSAISDALRENGLESIASAVQSIDFAELADSEEFTFFAPNDDAFQSLDADDMADLLGDTGRLEDTLRDHIVDQRIDAAALSEMSSVDTVGGASLQVAVDGSDVSVGSANVVQTDVEIDDGVVHVVDGLFIDS